MKVNSSFVTQPSTDDSMKAKKNLVWHGSKLGVPKYVPPPHLWKQQLDMQEQKPPHGQQLGTKVHSQDRTGSQRHFAFPQIQGLLQTPPPQVLVIERMHSGELNFPLDQNPLLFILFIILQSTPFINLYSIKSLKVSSSCELKRSLREKKKLSSTSHIST